MKKPENIKTVARWTTAHRLLCLASIVVVSSGGTVMAETGGDEILLDQGSVQDNYVHLTPGDSVSRILEHPAFKDFGRLMLPRIPSGESFDMPLSKVQLLMPYHNHVESDTVLKALNHMIDERKAGKTIFYSFYSEQQKRDDPEKENTGIFLFRGAPGAPFAIICPGGGFSYVGSLHEGYPLALQISQKKYNAFVIRYRTGSQQKATEDLAAAMMYIFRNAKSLGVCTDDYSLWGGSAGARMVGDIALNGVGYLPKPATIIIAYTGHTSYSKDFPPAFITVSENDPIVNAGVVDRRVANLRNVGVEVEYHRYRTAGHGFGLGTDTDAAGWLDLAVQFWERTTEPSHSIKRRTE